MLEELPEDNKAQFLRFCEQNEFKYAENYYNLIMKQNSTISKSNKKSKKKY